MGRVVAAVFMNALVVLIPGGLFYLFLTDHPDHAVVGLLLVWNFVLGRLVEERTGHR